MRAAEGHALREDVVDVRHFALAQPHQHLLQELPSVDAAVAVLIHLLNVSDSKLSLQRLFATVLVDSWKDVTQMPASSWRCTFWTSLSCLELTMYAEMPPTNREQTTTATSE